jgi:hypothetical protein
MNRINDRLDSLLSRPAAPGPGVVKTGRLRASRLAQNDVRAAGERMTDADRRPHRAVPCRPAGPCLPGGVPTRRGGQRSGAYSGSPSLASTPWCSSSWEP